MKKVLILDAGPLINLSTNGLLYLLEELKKKFDGHFLITEQVKYEVIDRPINVQRFEFDAMQVQALLDNGTLQLPRDIGIDEKEVKIHTEELMDLANNFIRVNGSWIELVSDAEMSCVALSNMLMNKGFDTAIAIDERTTRLLGEDPRELERIMSEKLHQRAELVSKDLSLFGKNKFFRSSEIVYVAFKKGMIHNLHDKKTLEAVLYATKFKGSAISFEEIDQIKKL